MKGLSIKLPDDLDGQLDAIAKRKGLTKSGLVREAIVAYVGQGDEGSFTTLAGDLAGSLSGPVDLASNPEHQSDYGR